MVFSFLLKNRFTQKICANLRFQLASIFTIALGISKKMWHTISHYRAPFFSDRSLGWEGGMQEILGGKVLNNGLTFTVDEARSQFTIFKVPLTKSRTRLVSQCEPQFKLKKI